VESSESHDMPGDW